MKRPSGVELYAELDRWDDPVVLREDDMVVRGTSLVTRLRRILVEQGLTAEEAGALIESNRRRLLEREGTRLLAILPRRLYDAALPLMIYPQPEKLVRVGVVWQEIENDG